jgi:hypothetical protein
MIGANLDASLMVGRTRSKRPRKPADPLFIGQWIRAMGHKPAEVTRAIGLNEGYLSELISGAKRNPGGTVLMDIADFLRIPVDYLRRPPPSREFLEQASILDPAVLLRLSAREKTGN